MPHEPNKREKRQQPAAPAAAPWPDSLLVNGGEMGAHIRAYDWPSTPLGPLEVWSQSLRSVVCAILASPYPMAILWGPGLIMLYNDAYAVIAGAKHPRAIGRPASESFAEFWEGIRDLLQGIMSTGAEVALDDMPFILERHGFPEETYINAGISAIRDDAGSIGGIFISEAESTRRVLAERRIATLSALAAEHAATTAPMACDRALTALATNPSDVPFALLYLLNDDGTTARLVDDLVDVTLVQSGEIQLRRDPVNLAGVVRNAVAEQRLAYPGRIITLDIPASAANAVVLADADRIAQVVANYLANALTYSDESQPVAVAVSLEPHADRVRVSVRDEGGGIASADQPRIWQRFERIEGQRHRSGSHIGLGLGLYIGKTIIERHSGSVGVTSAPGSGSALWFALPLVTEQRA